jgi:NitT/TauT family transport system ATP-binding protein
MNSDLSIRKDGMQTDPKSDITPKISVRNLSFHYDVNGAGELVLDDISLDVHDQEFVCLVGPSGCGKSTLLNIIAGLLPASSGKVLIDGVDIEGPGQDRTMVFQDDAVFPWYTVEQNVEYGLRTAKLPSNERKRIVDQLLDLIGLKDDREKFPRQLSGGMRKRVDLARALAPKPSVVLMDEPFAALDVLTKERLQQELLNIWTRRRMTVLFVTHDLEEALFLSQRVMIMSGHPAQIKHVVDVSLGQERDFNVKTSEKFQALRRELANYLAM